MKNFQVKTLVLGMIQTNCYIVSNEETKEAIVIDPADDAAIIEKHLKADDLVCKAILLTHGHFDHIMAAQELAASTNAPIYAHEEEAELLRNPRLNSSYQIRRECSLVPDVKLSDDQTLNLAGFMIRTLHTPGHTQGGVCYYFVGYQVLFSGDTLFQETIGRSDLPTGNGKLLVEGIRTKLMLLEDQVTVYPGHGNTTTIGHERENNIYISHSFDAFDL